MKFVCPVHPEITSNKKGLCDVCGMRLVKEPLAESQAVGSARPSRQNSYRPLVIVVGLILLTALAISYRDILSGQFELNKALSYIMIGIFLVFSGFKFIDLKGFAERYSQYDLLAMHVYEYGYVYPFIELFFGFSMVLNPGNRTLLWTEVVVMTFSGLGVLIKIRKKEQFQCACMGTFLKAPLTNITLIEDFGMAAIALYMVCS